MADQILKFGIPKGSLEEQTLELMRKSGWRITVGSRSYIPTTDDPTLSCRILRPQEMPRYIADGSLDAGITGSDWIVENNVTLHQVESFIYAKATLTPSRWVLCVRNDSAVQRLEDLQGKRIATELVQFVKRILAERKVKAEVEFSWGATEAKVAEGIIDAAIDVTETGSSLRANGLRIVEELLVSNPVLVANPGSVGRPVEAGQDSPARHPDSRRTRRGESRRHQDERREGKSRKSDRAAAVDHGADDLASIPVEGAEGRRMAGGRDGDRGANSARAVPETARSGRRGHRGVPAE